MKLTFHDIETAAAAVPGVSRRAAASSAWLQACDYPGISLLLEAVADTCQNHPLVPDVMGLDLGGVSCVFLGETIAKLVDDRGRLFLRNVRHGLYLLPLSVEANLAIGCPVDPAFALGGTREKNPYTEKLAIAARDGIKVDDEVWQALQLAGKPT